MFSNFAWSEMLVIACVAIIVVGPKDLPGMLRQFGKTIGRMKRMASDFQNQFNDALREADLDDVKDIASTKSFTPLEDAKKSMEDFAQTMKNPVKAITGDDDKDEKPSETPPKKRSSDVKPATKAAKPKPAVKKPAPAKPAAKRAPARQKTTPPKAATAKAKTSKQPAKPKAAKETT